MNPNILRLHRNRAIRGYQLGAKAILPLGRGR